MPAADSVARCLATAWRVMGRPAARAVGVLCGSASSSSTRVRRTGSARAPKIALRSSRAPGRAASGVGKGGEAEPQALEASGPLGAGAAGRGGGEGGLGDGQGRGAVVGFLDGEVDAGRAVGAIPGEGEVLPFTGVD